MPNADVQITPTFKLNPKNAHANKGGTLTWVNKTQGNIAIGVANKHVFGSPFSTVIAPRGRKKSPKVLQDCSYGMYEYSVYSYELKGFIFGSAPKIIVP